MTKTVLQDSGARERTPESQIPGLERVLHQQVRQPAENRVTVGRRRPALVDGRKGFNPLLRNRLGHEDVEVVDAIVSVEPGGLARFEVLDVPAVALEDYPLAGATEAFAFLAPVTRK